MTFRFSPTVIGGIAALVALGAVALVMGFPSSVDKVGYTGGLQAPSIGINGVNLVMPVQETKEACEELQTNAIKEGNEFKKLNPDFVFYVSDCVKLVYKKH